MGFYLVNANWEVSVVHPLLVFKASDAGKMHKLT